MSSDEDIEIAANAAIECLIPTKSKERYGVECNKFQALKDVIKPTRHWVPDDGYLAKAREVFSMFSATVVNRSSSHTLLTKSIPTVHPENSKLSNSEKSTLLNYDSSPTTSVQLSMKESGMNSDTKSDTHSEETEL